MSAWTKGFLTGAVVALVLAGIAARTTRFEAFVRVTSGDRFLFDARLDEPPVSRLINIPVAALGEASFEKRSWLAATTYAFSLRLRPEAAPGPGRAVQDLQVSVRLPGQITSTNATRLTGDAAVWQPLPAEELRLHTRAVHWPRIVVAAILAAAAIAAGRRQG